LPGLYEQIFNDKTKLEIGAVIGAVTLARNALEHVIDINGWKGLVLTVALSLLYGFFQYGLGANGALNGLMIGGLAAMPFFWTKNFGKILGGFFGSSNKLGSEVEALFVKMEERKNIFVTVAQVLKFLFVRK
jgi:hypothetical protein